MFTDSSSLSLCASVARSALECTRPVLNRPAHLQASEGYAFNQMTHAQPGEAQPLLMQRQSLDECTFICIYCHVDIMSFISLTLHDPCGSIHHAYNPDWTFSALALRALVPAGRPGLHHLLMPDGTRLPDPSASTIFFTLL